MNQHEKLFMKQDILFVRSCAPRMGKEHYHCVKCDQDKRKNNMKTTPKNKQGVCNDCYADKIYHQRHYHEQQQQLIFLKII